MHSAIIGLAHGKGTVRIRRDFAPTPDGDRYEVEHYHPGGQVTARTIDVIDGESARDTKARAVNSVGMLMHWPAMLAEIEHDAKQRPAREPAELTPAPERVTRLYLPPGTHIEGPRR